MLGHSEASCYTWGVDVLFVEETSARSLILQITSVRVHGSRWESSDCLMANIGRTDVIVLRDMMGMSVGVGAYVHLSLVPRLVMLVVRHLFMIEW